MKISRYRKAVSWLSLGLLVGNAMLPSVAWAAEGQPAEGNTGENPTQAQENTDAGANVIVTEDAPVQQVSTGQAISQASAGGEVNTNLTGTDSVSPTPVPSMIPTASPTPGEGDLSEGEVLGADLELAPSVSPTPSASSGQAPSATPTPNEECDLCGETEVTSENEATVAAEAVAGANTGGNEIAVDAAGSEEEQAAEATDEAGPASAPATVGEGSNTIQTGQAVAVAETTNIVNTNVVGSNWTLVMESVWDGSSGINIYDWWRELIENMVGSEVGPAPGGAGLGGLTVENTNSADVTGVAVAAANTGENSINGGAGTNSITTGNAYAVASVFNLVNTNIVGSNFLYFVLNIFGDLEGDIIVPSSDTFEVSQQLTFNQEQLTNNGLLVENNNEATVVGEATAGANTGENAIFTEGADGNVIETGQAVAVANSKSVVNTNWVGSNYFFLQLNRLGEWLGRVFGWVGPDEWSEVAGTGAEFEFGSGPGTSGVGGCDGCGDLIVRNNNQANVYGGATAMANTGGNSILAEGGTGAVNTGEAYAAANTLNIVNTNLVGGSWLFGFVNLFGKWTGDLVFARPDVAVGISDGRSEVEPGENVSYEVTVANRGQARARDVGVHFDFSPGLLSGVRYQPVGDLEAGEVRSFEVVGQVAPEADGEVVATARGGTETGQVSEDNDVASDVNRVVFQTAVQGEETELPSLVVSSWNNVGDYVYPGDTVLFEVTVMNKGAVAAHDVVLDMELRNEVPYALGENGVEVGDLAPGQGMKISFGLALNEELEAGRYYLLSQARGVSRGGVEVSSGEDRSLFSLLLTFSGVAAVVPRKLVEEVKAEGAEGEVLGDVEGSCEVPKVDWRPWALAGVLGAGWGLDVVRRKWLGK